jgi:hypothetical protein
MSAIFSASSLVTFLWLLSAGRGQRASAVQFDIITAKWT